MKNIFFNYYEADIEKSNPLGVVSLDYVVNAIRKPKKDIQHIFEQIQEAERVKDMAKKGELKTKLYSFTPCIFIKYGTRKYKRIDSFTGLLVLDFDHMESPEYAKEFKEYLFKNYDFIMCIWLSASKHGVRAIVKIPICTSVDEFKHYFAGIQDKFKEYKGFDSAPKNCILPMFISYDPEILVRENSSTWTKKILPIEKPIIKQYIINDKTNSIEKIILNNINQITVTGHVKLRATAYLLGGYITAGYIDYNYSIQMINNMIDSNAYLSQKASVYKKTAKQMIDKGMHSPIYLQQQN